MTVKNMQKHMYKAKGSVGAYTVCRFGLFKLVENRDNCRCETKRGASAHKCVCRHTVCVSPDSVLTHQMPFFSNFYGFSMNLQQFLAYFAYFCRFSESSVTFSQFLVVFTKKRCTIKTFVVLTHILKLD